MNLLFITISHLSNINDSNIYTDLMRTFRDKGHQVYIVSPRERRYKISTGLNIQENVYLLGVKTLNIQKTNVIEKGIGTVLIEKQFNRAIKKYLKDIKFDLILYSTPPITITNVIKALKKRNPSAIYYLLLKDIFPQNAIDLGMLSKNSFLYWYFKKKEDNIYKYSDYIGCMSPANVKYVIDNNSFVTKNKVEVAPNSIQISISKQVISRNEIRNKYSLPLDKPIFIYGGNLGKPQGIDFLIKCLNANKEREDCYFLVVGNGTEYKKFEKWYNEHKPNNTSLFKRLQKEDYDILVRSCDVGLIFLDHKFTIPNYPSRLLSYLENKMPIICATDVYTDIGTIAEENGYGFYCKSTNTEDFTLCINKFISNLLIVKKMGENGYKYLIKNYLVENTYNIIASHIHK